jgi:hypothetical protein
VVTQTGWDSDWLTAREAADEMGVTLLAMRMWLRSGLVPGAYRAPKVTSPWRIPRRSLAELQRRGTVTPLPPEDVRQVQPITARRVMPR